MPATPAAIDENKLARFIREYRAQVADLHAHSAEGELRFRSPFQSLLTRACQLRDWTLIPEDTITLRNGRQIRPDAVARDSVNLPRGYWEAKYLSETFERDIQRKIDDGYPLTNTIFQIPERAVLFQDGRRAADFDLRDDAQLVQLLKAFLTYAEPDIASFERAIDEFGTFVPDLAKGLHSKIADAHLHNRDFARAFAELLRQCHLVISPDLPAAQVDEMLVQHLLTERLFRRIFENPDFVARNVIARNIEQVARALTSASFSRDEFLRNLDRFYIAIERAAATLSDFFEKQRFLNTVYERFFQGHDRRTADTHGIVYTPQPIVDFICQSVIDLLAQEFGLSLESPNVIVLDPCTGTGNFVVNLLKRVKPSALPDLYHNRLFANEVLLMPYYIAALNIERAYYDLVGRYEPFEGLCFVDTLNIAKLSQQRLEIFTEENTQRVNRQYSAPITVIVGNPPYNTAQRNMNDNNPNRRYDDLDARIRETYARDSRATNKNKLYDPYVRFFRWATDRLEDRDGIVAFVTNNSFVDNHAFDGMRKRLLQEFTQLYHLDLGGNVRKHPELSGTTHNVFGIQVGVGITLAVSRRSQSAPRLFYHAVGDYWRAEQKRAYLQQLGSVRNVPWQPLTPDARGNWLPTPEADAFESLLPLGDKESKRAAAGAPQTVFATYSLGVATNRDNLVYSFDRAKLAATAETFIEIYNTAVDRWKRLQGKVALESLIDTTDPRIKWTRQLKRSLRDSKYSEFSAAHIRLSLYRPFCKQYLYFDDFWIEERYLQYLFFPTPESEAENRAICVSGIANNKSFHALMVNVIPDLHLTGDAQCFPFYVYDADGGNRRENITDWALERFRAHYADSRIDKWAIFHYSYAVLHHAEYRRRFAGALRKALPRLPFAADFWAYARAGQQLAELHVNYEQAALYPLSEVETRAGQPLAVRYRVADRMKLIGQGAEWAVQVNDGLRLTGVPPAALEYKLGNKAALEWVIDQYQVKAGRDPNRADDPHYIVNLLRRVCTVSVETVKIVNSLPPLF
jgi:predicted helicase